MNKADLIEALAPTLGDRTQAAAAVEALVDVILRQVSAGESVVITGFGTFEKVDRAARTGRNPRTGEAVPIPETSAPRFRPGTYFKDAVADPSTLPATGLAGARVGTTADSPAERAGAPASVRRVASGTGTTAAAGKTSAKKTAAAKPATKKATAKKATAKKSTATKTPAKQAAATKPAGTTSAAREAAVAASAGAATDTTTSSPKKKTTAAAGKKSSTAKPATVRATSAGSPDSPDSPDSGPSAPSAPSAPSGQPAPATKGREATSGSRKSVKKSAVEAAQAEEAAAQTKGAATGGRVMVGGEDITQSMISAKKAQLAQVKNDEVVAGKKKGKKDKDKKSKKSDKKDKGKKGKKK